MYSVTPRDAAGYLIVQQANIVLENYSRSQFAVENRELLAELRDTLNFLEPSRYRGVARQPISSEELGRLLLNIHNPFPGTVSDDDVVSTFELAALLFDELADRDSREILRVEAERIVSSSEPVLGFDIGYWGGDHFSLISDVAVMPRWHPPPPELFGAIADRLRGLNEHVLFSTAAEAASYLAFYRSQEWAEREFEPGEFTIICVARSALSS